MVVVAAKRKYRKRARKSGMGKCKISKCIKKYVKKTIHSQIENKTIQYDRVLAIGNILNSTSLYAQALTPHSSSYSIAQGLGQANRIGNVIRVIKATLNYILYPISYDAIANPSPRPCEVMLVFGNIKGNTKALPGGAVTSLYQNGNAAAGPDGTLSDILRPFNKDFWNVKKRIVHKVGCSAYTGTGAAGGPQYYNNNDFPYNVKRKLDLTSMFPKRIQFEDASADPTSNGLFLMMEAVSADNSLIGSALTPIGVEYWVDLVYEDA